MAASLRAIAERPRCELIRPPYEQIRAWPLTTRDFWDRLGWVAVLDLGAAPDADTTAAGIRALRRAGITVVLLRGSVKAERITEAAACMAAGARALLDPEAPIRPQLTQQIMDERTLAEEWLEWIELRCGEPLRPRLREDIRILLNAPVVKVQVEDVLREARRNPRTVRNCFAAAALPTPARFYHGGRLLRAQIRMIRVPVHLDWEIAEAMGYVDEEGLSNRIWAHFGVVRKRARKLLGLEWRFGAWWERAGLRSSKNLP